MKFIFKTFILILFFASSSGKRSYAQNESLRFEHIGIEEGLTNTRVTAMLQDCKGCLWIGTADGLNKKIFQLFFTTKPTRQGTGLGLSLSYDIVKAHGGELKVNTKEGKGSTFYIELPIVH